MIVCGIDPSLTGTGIAILRDGQPINHHREGWPGHNADSDEDRMERVVALRHKIVERVRPYRPDLIVIERPAISQINGKAIDRHFLWCLLVHEFTRRTNGERYAGVVPTTRAQFATGNGHAAKETVIDAGDDWWPPLNLRTQPVSRMEDNEADAYVLATLGAARYEPDHLPFELKDRHRNNLDAVNWPVIA